MALETVENNKTYLSIIQGTLSQKVPVGTEKAVKRIYEKADGSKSEKWELKYKNVSGYIIGMSFKDSDFGEQFILDLRDGEELYSLQTSVDGKYFSDFAKKVSNIYLDEEVVIAPFDFESEGKKRTGMTIYQEGVKLENFFWDGDKKKVLHKFPEPKGDTKKFDKDDWKVYFIDVKKFLKKHISTIVIPSDVQVEEPELVTATAEEAFETPAEQDDF